MARPGAVDLLRHFVPRAYPTVDNELAGLLSWCERGAIQPSEAVELVTVTPQHRETLYALAAEDLTLLAGVTRALAFRDQVRQALVRQLRAQQRPGA